MRRMSLAVMNDTSVAEAPEARRRVLFVNADVDLREVVSRVLENEGYEVRAVAHSGHAVLLSRTNRFDVIVTELSGPDVSGPTLTRQLRRHWPNLTAVYFGNPGTPEGAAHVVVRPFTREDLLERIESALSGVAA